MLRGRKKYQRGASEAKETCVQVNNKVGEKRICPQDWIVEPPGRQGSDENLI